MKNSASFLIDNNAPSSKMQDLVIDSRSGDVGPTFLFRHFLHKDAKISKLMTREDPYHLHKTLGVLAVANFIYRYGYCYPTSGTLGYNGITSNKHLYMLDWITMLVHTCLALSSIIFRVPKKRINNKPMVIYEEYRQHAMVFTLRCLVIFAIVTLFPNAPSWWLPLGVMTCHLLADRITSIHGTSGNTAVRATAKHQKLSPFYQVVGKLYSLYQFLAIGSHILPNARLADLAFNAVIAIQSSAFMMTLYRKRIIRGRTHMVVYAFCLLLSGYHICRLLGWWSCLLITITFVLRIKTPRKWSNKYVCWFLFLVMANFNWLRSVFASTSTVMSAAEMGATKGLLIAIGVYTAFKTERAVFKSDAPAVESPHSVSSSSKQDSKQD